MAQDPHNVTFWNDRWSKDQIGWHRDDVNPSLLKFMDTITGQKVAKSFETSQKTWFIPLCGKTIDIPYLLSQGFKVFGIEAVKKAVETLNTEHKLGMVYDETTQFFTGANGMLTIYVGDMFKCPVEKFGPFDYVWDRGSFVAVEFSSRKEYSNVMQKALKNSDGSWHNFSYLLETLLYDKSLFEGPPRSTSDEDLQEYFGSWSNFKLLVSEPVSDEHMPKGLNGCSKRLFHVTPKVE